MMWQALLLMLRGMYMGIGGHIGVSVLMVCGAALIAWGRAEDKGLVEAPVPWLCLPASPVPEPADLSEWETMS